MINKVGINGGAVIMALVILTSPSSDEEGEAGAAGETAADAAINEQAVGGAAVVSPTSAAIARLRDQAARLQAARNADETARLQAAAASGGLPGRSAAGAQAMAFTECVEP